jgi:hypothetical protein
MKAEEVERCPKCGAYCFPAIHSPDACAQIESSINKMGRRSGVGICESGETAVETKSKQ